MRGLLFALLFIALPCTASTDLIKRSSSGICHPPESAYYDRTKNYKAYDSVQDCLASGGRLPKNLKGGYPRPSASVDHQNQVESGYDRSEFGHGWADDDGDCQNSRMEALIEQSTLPVRFATDRECRVVSGRWISPFTGSVIHDGSMIDIDHVVPLKWAWERGAKNWSRERREAFANDPVNLWPVEASLTRSKGAKGSDQWLPLGGQCQYVSRFSRIIKIHQLEPDDRESLTLRVLVKRHC